MTSPENPPAFQHCGRRLKDLKPGRLITLTGEGDVLRYDTGEPIKVKTSIVLNHVSQVRPAGKAVVDGMPVNGDGTPRKNGIRRQLIVSEGAFLVWW